MLGSSSSSFMSCQCILRVAIQVPVRETKRQSSRAQGICRPRGFGFVEFRDPRDAEDALYHMDRTVFGGREISVVMSKESRKTPREMMVRERMNDPSPRRRRRSRSSRRRGDSRSPRRSPNHYSRGRRDDSDDRYRDQSRSRSRTPPKRGYEREVSHSKRNGHSPSVSERSGSYKRSRSPRRKNESPAEELNDNYVE